MNIKKSKPALATYVIFGSAHGIEFKGREDQELKAMRECGLYTEVKFVEHLDSIRNYVVLQTQVTLSQEGVEYFSTKCLEYFQSDFMPIEQFNKINKIKDSALHQLTIEFNLKLDEFVSSWVDADDETESAICSMIHQNHTEFNVIGEKVVTSQKASTSISGSLRSWKSTETVQLLDVHGCLVIMRFGQPDSFWYKKSDEATLFEKSQIPA